MKAARRSRLCRIALFLAALAICFGFIADYAWPDSLAAAWAELLLVVVAIGLLLIDWRKETGND